jgi:hypothetical protein
LAFLKREKFEPKDAVSALKKIAQLSQGHSFLSSHPDPNKRAERLAAQLAGRSLSIEENKQDIISRFKAFIEDALSFLYSRLSRLFTTQTDSANRPGVGATGNPGRFSF